MTSPSPDIASSETNAWYRQPETFIAVAALIVSVSAVVVGIYEASLQRAHDRAEVWPHVAVTTFTNKNAASVYIANNGIGPAILKSVVVTVDGHPRRNWNDAIGAYLGHAPNDLSVSTVADLSLRAGDKVEMFGLPASSMPSNFWGTVGRIGITVCYASVFSEYWELSEPKLGAPGKWRIVKDCPAQPDGVEF